MLLQTSMPTAAATTLLHSGDAICDDAQYLVYAKQTVDADGQ